MNRLKRRTAEIIKLLIWRFRRAVAVELALASARRKLSKLDKKPVFLVDNSLVGNATTHKSNWVSTGVSLWGGVVPVETGYECRFPSYDPSSEEKIYRETEYLVSITTLAREGLIRFVTSAELTQERMRQPRGRYIGYGIQDINLFQGISMPSIDGYIFHPKDCEKTQSKRINKCDDERFLNIKKLLSNGGNGNKINFDAWHLYTVENNEISGILTMDFKLVAAARRGVGRKNVFDRQIAFLPSDLAGLFDVKPIKPILLTYDDVVFFSQHDISISELKRAAHESGRIADHPEKNGRIEMKNMLPQAADMRGVLVDTQKFCVNIQYADRDDALHELSMDLPNAMYLLSLLKGIQLNLDIPFPDDPRDPNSPIVRPSERLPAD